MVELLVLKLVKYKHCLTGLCLALIRTINLYILFMSLTRGHVKKKKSNSGLKFEPNPN